VVGDTGAPVTAPRWLCGHMAVCGQGYRDSPCKGTLRGQIQQRFSFENSHYEKGIGLEGTT